MKKGIEFIVIIAALLIIGGCSSSKKFVLKKDITQTKGANSAVLHPPVDLKLIGNVGEVGYKALVNIYDGVLYIGNLEGDIYAISLNDNKKQKIITLKNEPIEASLYVKNDFLYAGTVKGNLYKINYMQKKIVKKRSFGFPIMYKIYDKNSVLYVLTEADKIYALDPDDLGVIWTYSNGSAGLLDIRSSSGILFLNDGLYCGFSDGSISKISYYGDKIWSSEVGKGSMFIDADSTPTGSNEVFVSSVNGYTEALSLDDSSVIWRRKLSTFSNIEENIYGLFLADENGNIVVLDNDNGETMWKKRLTVDGNIYSVKLIGNYVYALTNSGLLVVLNALNGTIMDIHNIGDRFSCQPVYYNNKLYVVSRDGNIYAVSSKK